MDPVWKGRGVIRFWVEGEDGSVFYSIRQEPDDVDLYTLWNLDMGTACAAFLPPPDVLPESFVFSYYLETPNGGHVLSGGVKACAGDWEERHLEAVALMREAARVLALDGC